MISLLIGAAGSGKSEYAERLAVSLPGRRIYLAAMEPFGPEAQARVEKHRAARSGLGFETVERYRDLAGLTLPPDSTVLLECLGNLTANELYSPQGGGPQAVLDGIEHLCRTCQNLTVVTNEVFSGGTDYAGDTLRYLRELAAVNRQLAARADYVAEIVCGLPNVLKGAAP